MNDWPTVPLGTLLTDVQPGFATGRHNSEGDGIPHFRPMNVSTDGHIERSVLKYVDPSAGRRSIRLLAGDIVFNNTNSPELVGKTALFEDDDSPAFSNHMTRLRVDGGRLDAKYAALRLHQAWREGWFAAHCNNHVSQASIGRDVLKAFEIELPPLGVQRAIASLSEAIDSSRGSASSHLSAARAAIDRFRQAVIAAACSGRLTADWRESSSAAATDFDPSAYIDRRIEPADGWVFNLPDAWQVVSLDQLTSLITSGSRGWAKYYADEGALFIRAQDISKDRLDLTDMAHVQPPRGAEGERTKVQVDDLLVTITGANVTKSARVEEQIGEAYVNQHIALARPLVPEMSEYLHLWLISPGHGRAKLENDAYGAGRPGLNLHNLRSTPVGLPPRNEQAEIVRRVRQLLQLAFGLQARIDAASKRVDRSSQAVLAKAFRGELVTTGEGVDGE